MCEAYCRNELNFGTLIWAWVEKTSHWLSGKENFPGAVVNKEGYIEIGAGFFLIIKNVVWPNPLLIEKVLIHHLGETLIDFSGSVGIPISLYLVYWALLRLA